jgi:LmbE family N-acetylglucosaminyl deacetylase
MSASNQPGQPPHPTVPQQLGPQHHTPVTRNLEPPRSALAIGAHPDDVEFGCGGTLAKWAAAGCQIHHLVCTDGSKGTWDPSADVVALAARRQIEQIEAARRLAADRPGSIGEVHFLGRVDGELSSDLATRAEVAKIIRMVQPEVVLSHDPWKQYRLHPDHRHAGLLAVEGIVAARDPHFFPEQGLAPHRPQRLLMWEAQEAHHVEDVAHHVDTKLHALLAHESQFESTMKATDPEELEIFAQRIRTRLAELGAPYEMAAAEIFSQIDRL